MLSLGLFLLQDTAYGSVRIPIMELNLQICNLVEVIYVYIHIPYP